LPQSRENNTEPATGAIIRSDQDLFGQMSLKSWSCLVLDTADKLAPMIGSPALELYYRMAQQVEAGFTGYEGAEEAEIRRIFESQYVAKSIHEFLQIFPKIKPLEVHL